MSLTSSPIDLRSYASLAFFFLFFFYFERRDGEYTNLENLRTWIKKPSKKLVRSSKYEDEIQDHEYDDDDDVDNDVIKYYSSVR